MEPESALSARIRERLEFKQMSPFEAARQIGTDRSFVNDVLIGRKKSMAAEPLFALAKLLDCDPEYLIALQDEVRRPTTMYPNGLPLKGVCEAGVWRSPGSLPKLPETLPVWQDKRYMNDPQCCFLVRGSIQELNIEEGSVLVCVENSNLYDAHGAKVIVRATRLNTGEAETSMRTVTTAPQGARGKVLASINPDFPMPFLPFDGVEGVQVEILGRVVEAVRMIEFPA